MNIFALIDFWKYSFILINTYEAEIHSEFDISGHAALLVELRRQAGVQWLAMCNTKI